MRLIVLDPSLSTVIADAGDGEGALARALANPSWAGLALAWTDGPAYVGTPAPEGLTAVDRTAPGAVPVTSDLSAYAATRRFEIETAGIEIGGLTIRTDRDSQGLIDRAYALSLVDRDSPIVFKAMAGPVTIDAATMQAVAVAVGRHVRDAFVREGQALLAIVAGTATTKADVDAILEPVP